VLYDTPRDVWVLGLETFMYVPNSQGVEQVSSGNFIAEMSFAAAMVPCHRA